MKFQAINLPAGAHDIFLAKPQKGSWICVFQNTDTAPAEYKEIILTTEKQSLTIKTTFITNSKHPDGKFYHDCTSEEEEKEVEEYVASCIKAGVTSPTLIIVRIE